MKYSISDLAKAFGISRNTLIYYDKKNLLKPSTRSSTNYRLYNDKDYHRLSKIMAYREAGIPLQTILDLLEDSETAHRISLLKAQIEQLNSEILRLRKQQQASIELLKCDQIAMGVHSMTKDRWSEILSSTGMSDEDMWQWHVEFERSMPEAHQSFLESLNISSEEIRQIREKSRFTN